MKRFILIALCSALAGNLTAAPLDEYLRHGRSVISGYGDVGYQKSDFEKDTFSGRFVPIFLYQLNDKIHVEAELEFSVGPDGETETELEYADLHYFLADRITLTAGKFLLPFAQFGPNFHPSWVNRLPTAPGLYGGHGGNGLMSGLMPVLSDYGLAGQFSHDFGGNSRLFLDLYVVNGISAEADDHSEEAVADEHEAILFPELEFESSSADNNDNKAVGGRLAFAFLPQWEAGASFYQSKYDDTDDLDFQANAFDINWIGQYWSVRGEYIRTEADALIELEVEDDHGDEEPEADEHDEEPADDGHEEVFVQKNFDRNGWYVQAAWQARQLNMDMLNPVEFIVRHSRTREVDEGERWTFGINYWMTPSAALKLAWEDTEMDDGRDDTRVFLQLSFGF